MDRPRTPPPTARWWIAGGAGAALMLVVAHGALSARADGDRPAESARLTMQEPRYTEDGRLLPPSGWEAWVLAGSSLGLGYGPRMSHDDGPGMFHTVYLQPEAYRAYAATGRFPEKTMFVMAIHQPANRAPPSQRGWYAGDLIGVEVAVKDRARSDVGWAYYDFGPGGTAPSARAFPSSGCAACHVKHGADDNVFVQFYPALRALLAARGRPAAAPGP